jgi:hypothetical protein
MSRGTPITEWRQKLDAGKSIVETKVEVDALHLAVGYEIGSSPKLVVHGQLDGIAHRLLSVICTETFGTLDNILAKLGVPAR